MRFCDAFGIRRGETVAFVGAGGKTSAMFRVGRELAMDGWRVLATTTTRLAEEELALAPAAVGVGDDFEAALRMVWRQLSLHRFVLVYRVVSGGKVWGLAPEAISRLTDRVNSDVMLVEADGARRLPFKVPRVNEPVIPPGTTLVVPVVGLDVIGKPLDDEHVFNPEPLTEIYGFPEESPIYAAWVAQALRHNDIGLRGVPAGVRVVPLLNKADDRLRQMQGRAVARIALRTPARTEESRIDAVVIGAAQRARPALEVRRRVGAVVLAAGLSTRMGRPKVLLPWGRQTVIEAIVRRLWRADLSEIVVVTGYKSRQVEAAVAPAQRAGAPVRCVYNPIYRAGEMLSSFQAGVDALSDQAAACLLTMGDQPLLSGRVLWMLLEAYARGQGGIVAPAYEGKRGHPVLFDRVHWPELLALEPGERPRDVLRRHDGAVRLVPVRTDWVLRDIDTPADYARARREVGLA